jgi:hypothetical protein
MFSFNLTSERAPYELLVFTTFPFPARLDNVPTEVMFVWAAVESVPAKVTPVIVPDEVISPVTSKSDCWHGFINTYSIRTYVYK